MAMRRWLGRAVPIAEVYTITIAQTWATSDSLAVTINGKSLVLTVGADATITQVATAITEMLNGSSQTGTGDHAFSALGSQVGEFSRLTATSVAGVVTVTAKDKGKPFTLSVVATTAGNGTGVAVNTVNATGPNHFDNVDNWSGDTVPVDGDTILFDHGETSCLYALSTSMQPAALTITQGFTGTIGLPLVNFDNPSYPYDEYRETYLTFVNDSGTAALLATIGEGEGQGSGRIYIDFGDATAVTVNVLGSGSRLGPAAPPLLLKGGDSATILNVQRGDVGYAFYEGDSGALAQLNVGYLDDQDSDSTVVAGSSAALTNSAIAITGGETWIASETDSGTIKICGGSLTVLGGSHASIVADGGIVFYQSVGTCTGAIIGPGATLDMRRDNRSRTFTNLDLHAGSALYDPHGTIVPTNGFDLVRCAPGDLIAFDVAANRTWTPTGI